MIKIVILLILLIFEYIYIFIYLMSQDKITPMCQTFYMTHPIIIYRIVILQNRPLG
jgi:hypothetical protein